MRFSQPQMSWIIKVDIVYSLQRLQLRRWFSKINRHLCWALVIIAQAGLEALRWWLSSQNLNKNLNQWLKITLSAINQKINWASPQLQVKWTRIGCKNSNRIRQVIELMLIRRLHLKVRKSFSNKEAILTQKASDIKAVVAKILR